MDGEGGERQEEKEPLDFQCHQKRCLLAIKPRCEEFPH